jgi:hypothetical protein
MELVPGPNRQIIYAGKRSNGNDATRFHCICMKISKIHTPPNICTCGIFEKLRYIETFIQLDTEISDMSFSF